MNPLLDFESFLLTSSIVPSPSMTAASQAFSVSEMLWQKRLKPSRNLPGRRAHSVNLCRRRSMRSWRRRTSRSAIAMAESALVATRRLVEFGRVYHGYAELLLARQERCFALVEGAGESKLLPYEAQMMREYWESYRLALRGVTEIWFGPRKRPRFVMEIVGGSPAMGYSPVDAAINYLHRRRLRQAELLNKEVGFPGTSDGFLHRKRHNSRKIGILFDDRPVRVRRQRGTASRFPQSWNQERRLWNREGPAGDELLPSDAWCCTKAGRGREGRGRASGRLSGRDMHLSEAYRRFAEGLLEAIESSESAGRFTPFAFDFGPRKPRPTTERR